MPNRDYAVRPKKAKKGINRTLILAIVVLLLMVSFLGLWVLKENAPVRSTPTQTVTSQQPKRTLPSPPEEVYSYIRDLETREVPINNNSKLAKLTKEQELQIQRQKEEEQRKLTQSLPSEQVKSAPSDETDRAIAQELSLKKAQEKQLEQKKQEEAKKLAESQKAKQDASKVAVNTKPTETKATGKFGLQCGAFKNKAQAENMQARLAMAGYNARINSNGEWNRVIVGPIGDRAAASSAQSNARSVAECLIVGM